MKRDDAVSWRGLGRVEKITLVLVAIFALLFFSGIGQRYQTLAGLAAIFMGIVTVIKVGRMAMRNLIWRLRDRLIVAYLFIAVVPVVLLLSLMLVTSYALVGQMAVYLVNRELENRARTLSVRAESLTRAPARDPQIAMTRALTGLQRTFPSFQILATGDQHFVFPENSQMAPPPEQWKNASGLVTRNDGGASHLYIWAHAEQGGNEVTILAPVTAELLASLVPGIGDITFPGYTERAVKSHVPAAVNSIDFSFSFLYPVFVPSWENPQGSLQNLYFVVTRGIRRCSESSSGSAPTGANWR